MKLSVLLEGVDVLGMTGSDDNEMDVTSLCYNSRQCSSDSLFVAVTGLKADGHDYIADAVRRGAKVVVCEREIKAAPEIMQIRVKNGRRTLGLLAKKFYADPAAELVAVGVVGNEWKNHDHLYPGVDFFGGRISLRRPGDRQLPLCRPHHGSAQYNAGISGPAEDFTGDDCKRGDACRCRGIVTCHRPQTHRRLSF